MQCMANFVVAGRMNETCPSEIEASSETEPSAKPADDAQTKKSTFIEVASPTASSTSSSSDDSSSPSMLPEVNALGSEQLARKQEELVQVFDALEVTAAELSQSNGHEDFSDSCMPFSHRCALVVDTCSVKSGNPAVEKKRTVLHFGALNLANNNEASKNEPLPQLSVIEKSKHDIFSLFRKILRPSKSASSHHSSKSLLLTADEASSVPPSIHMSVISNVPKLFTFSRGKILGRGASGVVRLTETPCCHKFYAVKAYNKKKKSELPSEYVKRITSEYAIGLTLHHPNIVKVLDVIKDDAKWFQIMEYCTGGDLFSIIKEGNLRVEDIDCLFKQLIYGVAYLHGCGIAHRDLKPENLLIDDFGQLKITDFGVAISFRSEDSCDKEIKRCTEVCGSGPYIAPEAFSGKEYDPRCSDVWACGVVYCAMTFHAIPWETACSQRDSNFRHFLECRSTQGEPFVRLGSRARRLVFRMLDPDPAKRISIPEILKDDWFQEISVCVPYPKEFFTGSNQPPPLDESDHNHFTAASKRSSQGCDCKVAPDLVRWLKQ